jgi:hypothetical protein
LPAQSVNRPPDSSTTSPAAAMSQILPCPGRCQSSRPTATSASWVTELPRVPDAAATRLQSRQELEVLLTAMPLTPDDRAVVESPGRHLQPPSVRTAPAPCTASRARSRAHSASRPTSGWPRHKSATETAKCGKPREKLLVPSIGSTTQIQSRPSRARFRLFAEEAGLREPLAARAAVPLRCEGRYARHEVAGSLASQVGGTQLMLGPRDARRHLEHRRFRRGAQPLHHTTSRGQFLACHVQNQSARACRGWRMESVPQKGRVQRLSAARTSNRRHGHPVEPSRLCARGVAGDLVARCMCCRIRCCTTQRDLPTPT